MKPNYLAGLELDRAAILRKDPSELERMWSLEETRVLPVWRSQHLTLAGEQPALALLSTSSASATLAQGAPRVLLGQSETRTFFAVDLSHLERPLEQLELDDAHALMGLREVAPRVTQHEGALLAYANGILSWHARHRFCGSCGSETDVSHAGHVRRCRNAECGREHFPRTDPAVIMLVTYGDQCLLGRQASWPSKVYSTLAGFVEPGESLEEAVAREVREETGVEITDARYHSSQPWPFPSSLMIGFTARATTTRVELADQELQDARWFTRGELRDDPAIQLPSAISIARRLIEDWLG